jgi:hypothetical protein
LHRDLTSLEGPLFAGLDFSTLTIQGDEHLTRLMLRDEEQAHLDRLWQDLKFVSREPLRLVTAYEQIWQFSTQDADPTKIEPLEAPVRAGAAAFEKTLARVFTSAAYLYKAETPAPGPKHGPVKARELATRRSYFLTSSTPDLKLTQTAAEGSPTLPGSIISPLPQRAGTASRAFGSPAAVASSASRPLSPRTQGLLVPVSFYAAPGSQKHSSATPSVAKGNSPTNRSSMT